MDTKLCMAYIHGSINEFTMTLQGLKLALRQMHRDGYRIKLATISEVAKYTKEK